MATKEKGFGYWVSIIIGSLTILSTFAAAAKWKNDVEKKTKPIAAVVWDLQLLKQAFNRTYPVQYDSALITQIKINGPRPLVEDDK